MQYECVFLFFFLLNIFFTKIFHKRFEASKYSNHNLELFVRASTKILSSVEIIRFISVSDKNVSSSKTRNIFFSLSLKLKRDALIVEGASEFNFHPRTVKKATREGKEEGEERWTRIIVRIPSYEFGGRSKAGAKRGMRTIQREEQWFFIAPPRNRFNGSFQLKPNEKNFAGPRTRNSTIISHPIAYSRRFT